ncbi:MAG: translation initiation factor IF-3 [Candidatus Eisenbacteria bacterium]
MNRRIRVPQVRVVGDDGEQIGVISTEQALAMAEEKGLDLVEVASNAKPPVCRIMDYGKYKYQQSKRAQKAKQKQHVTHLKEVKLRPKIEEHDYQFKLRNALRFLEGRDKVKVTIMFRGREMAHIDIGRRILDRFVADVGEGALLEVPPKMEGRTMSLVLSPKARIKTSEPKLKEAPEPAEGEGAGTERT